MNINKVSYGTLKIIDGNREPVVELKNGHCIVKQIHLSMSKNLKFRLIMNLIDIGLLPIILLGYILGYQVDSIGVVILVITIATLSSVFCMLITMLNFRDWCYTKNKQLEQMGEWYAEDCINIINDLIKAGSKVAAQLVEEERNGNSEDSKTAYK